MAVGHDAGAGHDLRCTPAHARYVADQGRVGARRVEPEKAHLADDLAGRIETFDADVVEPGGTVHGGARHGLGHQHQFGGIDQGNGFGRQAGLAGLHRPAQNAQAGIGLRDQADLVAVALQVVVSRTEKGEVPVLQPVQEIDALLLIFRGKIRLLGRGADGLQARENGGPVLHGGAHIAEHPRQRIGQRLLFGGADNAVAFDQDQGFNGVRIAGLGGAGRIAGASDPALGVAAHAHQRMNNPVSGAAGAIDRHGDRIHEERHVVLHDLNHGVLADKAVLSERRVEHAHPGALRRARRIEQAPVRIGDRVKRGRAAGRDLVGISVLEVGGNEAGLPAGCRSRMFLQVGEQFA